MRREASGRAEAVLHGAGSEEASRGGGWQLSAFSCQAGRSAILAMMGAEWVGAGGSLLVVETSGRSDR